MDFSGFLASSTLVAMTSKPMKPKKQVAAPARVPEMPKGKNPPLPPETEEGIAEGGRFQFSGLALYNPGGTKTQD